MNCGRCGKPLTATPEAHDLYNQLRKLDVPAELEKCDGYKHIDIAVVEAKVNIEVDGSHHNRDKDQALADLKRTFHSFKKGFLTLRIPNVLVHDQRTLQITAKYIAKILNESLDQLED